MFLTPESTPLLCGRGDLSTKPHCYTHSPSRCNPIREACGSLNFLHYVEAQLNASLTHSQVTTTLQLNLSQHLTQKTTPCLRGCPTKLKETHHKQMHEDKLHTG